MLNLPNYNIIIIGQHKFYYKSNSDLSYIFEKLISRNKKLLLQNVYSFFKKEYIKGTYSIVIDSPLCTFIISDIVRTYPVLYKLENGSIIINEDLKYFNSKSIDKLAVSDFIHTFFSIGSNTIFEHIKTVQSAEILFYNKQSKQLESSRYFKFASHKNLPKATKEKFIAQYNKNILKVFKDIINDAPNFQNWIVPLSGGHDSRQIVNSLYKLGIKNVICFSYGKLNNTQAILSKEVAKALGYQWFFVEYTEEKWHSLHDNGLINKYIDFAFQGISTPHLQDFLAIYELKEKGVIKETDIVIPGHTLDMTAGGHLTKFDLECKTKKQAIHRAIERHGWLYPDLSSLETNLYKRIGGVYDEAGLEPYQFQEYINWQERQAKFIVNSCRVYDFFNLEFRLPFWDKKLVELLLELPVEQRMNRQFFKDIERKGILVSELARIPFADELVMKKKKSKIKSTIKNVLPSYLKVKLRILHSHFIHKFYAKAYNAESLNQIYALKASTVNDLIGPLRYFPEDKIWVLKPFFLLPTYKASYHTLSWLYAISFYLKNERNSSNKQGPEVK